MNGKKLPFHLSGLIMRILNIVKYIVFISYNPFLMMGYAKICYF